MYLNFCNYSLGIHTGQRWQSSLEPYLKIFLWLQGTLQDLQEPSKGRTPGAIRRQKMTTAPHGTYAEQEWPGCAGLPEMQQQNLSQQPLPLLIIPKARNWDYPNGIATQMIRSQKKNHIQTTLTCLWLKTPHACYCQQRKMQFQILAWYGRDPTYAQQ